MLNRRHSIHFGIAALSTWGAAVARAATLNDTPNVYPLHMPPGITGNAPVTMGTGPDTLVAVLSYADPMAHAPEFAILMDGVPIAAPLTLSTKTGPGRTNPQVWTIHGAWGPGPHVIRFQGITGTLNNMTFVVVTYNYRPYVTNTMTDSRNTRNVNAPQAWVSNGAPTVDFTPAADLPQGNAPAPASAYIAAPTRIVGARINGNLTGAGTLEQLLAVIPDKATLALPAGRLLGTAAIGKPIAIAGAGAGKTVLSCAGLEPTADKAILVPHVSGFVVSDLTLSGAQIAADDGNNAAGIRDSGVAGGTFTLIGVEITSNQDGILSNGGNWVLTHCTVHDNGGGDGLTHELYFNDDNASNSVTLTDCTVTQGMRSTHAVKSRAAHTVIAGGAYATAGNPDDAVCGTLLDFPNGGTVTITGAHLTLRAGSAVTGFIGYAMEKTGATNRAAGTTMTLTNCVFIDQTGTGGFIANGRTVPDARLVLQGCTYTGGTPPRITGFGSVVGTMTQAQG